MKKQIIVFLILIVPLVIFLVSKNKSELVVQNADNSYAEQEQVFKQSEIKNNKEDKDDKEDVFAKPLEQVGERITKKSFGTFVTPQNSPVKPERFSGYHTGVDLEIIPGEEDKDIKVKAICRGKILVKRSASGYGGVAVQQCDLDGNFITVVYGHLDLKSINKNIGEQWEREEIIGILGKGYSSETDGERKHLHLGIHKGGTVNILGYIPSKEKLSDWIDPCLYVCGK